MSIHTTLLSVIVEQHELGLECVPGEPTRALAPGKHRRDQKATYRAIDARQRLLLVAPQEILTADRVTVKVTAVVTWAVTDAIAFTEVAEAPFDGVYLAVQLALRDAVSTLSLDDLLAADRPALADRLTASAAAAGEPVGIVVREVAVKDVILPADLRSAYAEVVGVRQRAVAKLEAARAETAALRSLANGAALLDQHPALARIRLIEALPVHAQVTLALDPASAPPAD